MGIEQEIERNIFKQNPEKSSADKVMARADIDRLQSIMAKKDLTREDIQAMTAYMSGMESKLFNLSEHERFTLLTFFVWIEEFVKLGESVYNQAEEAAKLPKAAPYEIAKKNRALIEHMFKFLANLYLNIARTSISYKGTGFIELLNNSYKVQYNMDSKQLMEQKV